MKIWMITPAPAGSRSGNRVTALRWARMLRRLGHQLTIRIDYADAACDLMIALHARRSAKSIKRFHATHPNTPLIVALTGTDLYRDIRTNRTAQQSLDLATRLVVLQEKGIEELPRHLRSKARVIRQSAVGFRSRQRKPSRTFDVCVIGHLREVKDPFRAAMAARLLPPLSPIRVLHVGAALTSGMAARARDEMRRNARYRWLGEKPHWQARRVLARSHLLVHSSKMEGGANVISEALAAKVPVLSSEICGSIGMLGPDYPGYFPLGDTRKLAALLQKASSDGSYYVDLQQRCAQVAPLFEPSREIEHWKDLLSELFRSR